METKFIDIAHLYIGCPVKWARKKGNIKNETFPTGTIVSEIKNSHYCFEVVEGEMKGKKGGIADGLFKHDFVCDDTQENRDLIRHCLAREIELQQLRKENFQRIDNVPSINTKP